MLESFTSKHHLPESFKVLAEQVYIPLAFQLKELVEHKKATIFIGVNGCQGSGKSTLCEFITGFLAEAYSLNTLAISLDDFYLSSRHRQKLANEKHPLLKTRGVPGTHNIKQLESTIKALKSSNLPCIIPRFDKLVDEPKKQSAWTTVSNQPDIVMIEGWCWGVNAQEEQQLVAPVNELEREHDQDGRWRKYVNQQLKQDYQPLYALMDFWVMLKAPSYACVYGWRLEQEQKTKALHAAVSRDLKAKTCGQSPEQVAQFIQYFQRLTLESFAQLPSKANWLINLNSHRQIESVNKADKKNAHS